MGRKVKQAKPAKAATPVAADQQPRPIWIQLIHWTLTAGLFALPWLQFPWHHWAALACVGGMWFAEYVYHHRRGPPWPHVFLSLVGGLLLVEMVWHIAGADAVRFFRVGAVFEEEEFSPYVLAPAGVLVTYGALGLLWRAGHALRREIRWVRRHDKSDD